MKTSIINIIAAIACVGAFSGCTHAPRAINPQLPISSSTEGMTLTDARRIDRSDWARGKNGAGVIPLPKWVQPEPEPDKVIGDALGLAFVAKNGLRAVDIVGGIVANKYPGAKVTLRDFRSFAEMGLWMNNFTVIIVAEVEHAGGSPVEFRGVGENSWSNPNDRNFEIGFERALDDFARKINAAPADLSRVVKN